MNDRIVLKAMGKNDHYRTLLRKSLEAISLPGSDTLPTWLAELEETLHTSDDMGERLEANAMIVGVLSVMLDTIEGSAAERGSR